MTEHISRAHVQITDDMPADLATFIGRALRSNIISQDCVNVPMIRHCVEAMGDGNPVYVDRRTAQTTGRSDIVAPASRRPAKSPIVSIRNAVRKTIASGAAS